jgi:hypothetical protein
MEVFPVLVTGCTPEEGCVDITKALEVLGRLGVLAGGRPTSFCDNGC